MRLIAPPSREELLRGLATRLRDVVPGWRPLAESILGAGARIDFVGLQPGDQLTAVLVGEADDDLVLVARGLAQTQWLAERIPDWLQLSRELTIRPDLAVQGVLLCPAFRAEARAAAEVLGARLRLVTYRFVQAGSRSEPLLELVLPEAEPEPENAPFEPVAVPSAQPAKPATPVAPSVADESEPFRTGLRDEDLGLTPEELTELE